MPVTTTPPGLIVMVIGALGRNPVPERAIVPPGVAVPGPVRVPPP
jgi:hypothetical protein